MSDDRAAVEARIRADADAGRWTEATTATIATYGDELLGYLVGMTRNETDAADTFSLLAEDIWRGLPRFRWDCTLRTWTYCLARHALVRLNREAHRKRARPLDDAKVEQIVEQVRSRTATYLRTETRDRVARLRAELDPDDQTLLALRFNRGLAWRDIARVLAADGDALTPAALDKLAAALRKRFERLKVELKAKARAG